MNHSPMLLSLFLQHPLVCTDTRSIKAGCIFFALKGEKFDGNAFARQALESGAAYVVIDDRTVWEQDDPRYILVPDTLKALQDLARAYRRTLKMPVIGITGSNGKTTTKELIAAVLKTEKRIYATQGNYNNHIGVPLTLLAIPQDVELAIVEMGTNQPGDIQELVEIAEPTHGVITNIGYAHIEKLGGLGGVEVEKGQMFRFIQRHDGWAFVNVEDKRVVNQAAEISRKITYGKGRGDFAFRLVENTLEGMVLAVKIAGKEQLFQTPLSGEHNAMNITLAVAIGTHFGISLDNLKTGVAAYKPTNHRSQLIERAAYKIWMDAYNANPSSVKATIEHLASLRLRQAWILGDMFELGAESRHAHTQIAKHVSQYKPDWVLLVGKEMRWAYEELKDHKNVLYAPTLEEIPADLASLLTAKKIELVLLKASRGMRLEELLDKI